MTDPDPTLAAARRAVTERIAAAAQRSGREAGDVTLVAVSKTVPADRLRLAVAAGLSTLGENRVQEAESKVGEVLGATWHLVGPLQSNKVRRAVAAFDVIESVDSAELAERIDRLARNLRGASHTARYPILLQVNVDDDAAKAGIGQSDLPAVLERITALDALEVQGLMTIGRLVADAEAARPTFTGLRELSASLRAGGAALGPALSMGMSDDFEVAIEEGATIVRVGRALFGARP